MEKKTKYLLVALLCIMLISTLAAALITLWLSTTGKLRLHLPSGLEADITEWDWGIIDVEPTTGLMAHTQNVVFTNLGTTPLQLSACPVNVFPQWFSDLLAVPGFWWLTWTGQDYILEPYASVATTFTLTIDGAAVAVVMEDLELIEADFRFDINVTTTEATVIYSLTIQSMVGGITSPVPGVYEYALGSSVRVEAVPDLGYTFDHWILDADTRAENPTYVMMDADHTLTAYFEEVPTYTLSIATTSGGTTDPVPGTHDYSEGSTAIITAIPDVSFVFDCWDLDGVNDTINPISVLMGADHSVIAYFKEAPVAETRVYVDPEHNNFAVEETFTITVIVADIENFYGFDIRFSWNTSILEYVSHIAKVPVETYPDGVLHYLATPLKDIVDADAGTYWVAYASWEPAPSFNGMGIAFEITFRVANVGSCTLDVFYHSLSDKDANPIEHIVLNGYFDNTA